MSDTKRCKEQDEDLLLPPLQKQKIEEKEHGDEKIMFKDLPFDLHTTILSFLRGVYNPFSNLILLSQGLNVVIQHIYLFIPCLCCSVSTDMYVSRS